MKKNVSIFRRRRGQGMTEYVVIVGLIAIGAISAVVKFKNALGGAFGKAEGAMNTLGKSIEDSAKAIQ